MDSGADLKYLNRLGYKYPNTCLKGMMSPEDFKNRLQFCRKLMQNNVCPEFWKKRISFYLNATGLEYKCNS